MASGRLRFDIAFLGILLALLPAAARAQTGRRIHHRAGLGRERRRAAGRHRHRHEPGDQRRARRRSRTRRATTPSRPSRSAPTSSRPSWPASGRPRPRRSRSRRRQVARLDFKMDVGAIAETVEVERRPRRSCRRRPATVGEVLSGNTVQSLPLNGRNTGQLALLLPGHGHLQPARLHQHRQHQHEPSVRERQPRADQQLHGRRPRRQRDDRQPRRLSAQPRRARRDQRRDQQLRGRRRQRRRRRDQQRHQVGREPVPRQRVRVLPQQRLRREHVGEQPVGRGQAGAQAAHLRRHPRRTDRQRHGCSSSPTTRDRARTRPGFATASVAPEAWRRGDLSSIATPIRDPLTGLPFPGQPDPGRAGSARPRARS